MGLLKEAEEYRCVRTVRWMGVTETVVAKEGHVYMYSGSIPCTGPKVCMYCGRLKLDPVWGCFAFNVPVYVTIEDDSVVRVDVDDGASIREGRPRKLDGNSSLGRMIRVAENGQSWPAWEFGI